MVFWGVSVLLILLAVAGLCWPLFRGRGEAASRAEHDMQVYKDQLREIERDLARGVLEPAEAEATRTEVSRRLLGAAEQAEKLTGAAHSPVGVSRGLAAGMALFLFLATAGLYLQIGASGRLDQPLQARIEQAQAERAARLSQADAEARMAELDQPGPEVSEDYLALVNKLREAMKERPDEVQGLRLLGQHLPRIGEWAEAAVVQRRLIEILGAAATGDDYADLAEDLIIAAGGYVSPEAEDTLETGMQLDPSNPRIRFYAGHALLQSGRPDLTYSLWTRLLEEGPEDAPWVLAIREQITDVAAAIGAPVPRGPNAEDIEAAGQMSEGDRQQMIETMVATLAERLGREGGPPEDWAQLIRAYGVLGETGKASAIWNEARETFADNPTALNLIRRAARDAEVAQ